MGAFKVKFRKSVARRPPKYFENLVMTLIRSQKYRQNMGVLLHFLFLATFCWKSENVNFACKILTIFLDSEYGWDMSKNEFWKKSSKVFHVLENVSWWLLLASGDILRPFGTIWEQLVFWHKNTHALMARAQKCDQLLSVNMPSNFKMIPSKVPVCLESTKWV